MKIKLPTMKCENFDQPLTESMYNRFKEIERDELLNQFTRRSHNEMNYEGPIFKKNWLKEFRNQKIDYKNIFFLLGYDIYFISDSKHLSDDARVSSEIVKHHVGFSFKGQGLASFYKKHSVYCIAIVDDRDDMDIIRLIEVLTHEASHVVDYIIENCAIHNVDTELRAYILDHIVGLCLRKLKIADKKFYSEEKICQS